MTPLRLLLLEDSEDDAYFVQRQLKQVGLAVDIHRVDDMDSFRKALDEKEWDVVLSDFNIPGFSGIAALKYLRSTSLDIPFVLVSGAIGEEVAVEAMREGARDYLLKDNLARLGPVITREVSEAKDRRARRLAEERQRTLENALQEILRGTSSAVGVDFFRSLVASLARSLGVTAAIVSKLDENGNPGKILAKHGLDDETGDDIVKDPLFRKIIRDGEVSWNVGDPSSTHPGIRENGFSSLLGVRLESREGHPHGLLVVLDEKPISDPSLTRDIMTIFASRAGSELDRLENERRKLEFERDLYHRQKLEAIGTLASGIAHDINNILTAIWGHAQLLQMSVVDDFSTDSVEGILQGCTRARDLAKRMLLFGRKQEMELQPVDLETVLKDVALLLKSTLPPSVILKIEVPEGVPQVLGDPNQLNQVFMNLCTNAIQAIASNAGTISISVQASAQRHQESGRTDPQRCLEIRIADTGRGIPEEVLPRIFEPFFTTKVAGQGTGLGLSVVHGILRNHGGSISVESVIGTGTTFLVLLPVSEPEESESTPSRSDKPGIHSFSVSGSRREILVVDDEEGVADVLQHLLKLIGYECTAFCDPKEAMDAFAKDPDRWGAVISDYSMPGVSGIELGRFVKTLSPDTKFLLTSGFESVDNLPDDDRLLVSHFITKPFQISDIGNFLDK